MIRSVPSFGKLLTQTIDPRLHGIAQLGTENGRFRQQKLSGGFVVVPECELKDAIIDGKQVRSRLPHLVVGLAALCGIGQSVQLIDVLKSRTNSVVVASLVFVQFFLAIFNDRIAGQNGNFSDIVFHRKYIFESFGLNINNFSHLCSIVQYDCAGINNRTARQSDDDQNRQERLYDQIQVVEYAHLPLRKSEDGGIDRRQSSTSEICLSNDKILMIFFTYDR